jgi:glycosyltransferase involved in cell wall biosynthesis
VLFVSADLAVGGSERQWAVLIPLLHERGFAPTVLTLLGTGRFYDELEEQGIPVHCVGMRHRADPGGLRRAVAYGVSHRSIVVSQSVAAQVVGEAIARLARKPHVTTEHQPAGLPRRPHQRLLLKLLAPRIRHVVAVTSSQIPDLVDLGYRRDRIRVIPNGIPPIAPGRDALDLRRSLGLEDRFVAILVARMHPQKQPELFVEAVRLAAAREPAVCGLVVGAGPDSSRVAAAAARSGGAVRLLGERSDAVDLLAMADVVCLSSFAEGLPMVLLEAMALGRPIVATDVGGTSDAVVSGATGLLVRSGDVHGLADALLRLVRDARLRERLGRQARRRHAELFSADAMADRYALLLESIVASRLPT